MADRASAIIISKRHILLIHRVRRGQEYYVFPGGNIEKGESAEEACIREVLEETGLQTTWLQPAFDYDLPDRVSRFFFVQTQPGAISLGGPESQKQSEENRYLLEWIPLAQVGSYDLRPPAVRDALAAVSTQDGPVREAADLAARREQMQEMLRRGE